MSLKHLYSPSVHCLFHVLLRLFLHYRVIIRLSSLTRSFTYYLSLCIPMYPYILTSPICPYYSNLNQVPSSCFTPNPISPYILTPYIPLLSRLKLSPLTATQNKPIPHGKGARWAPELWIDFSTYWGLVTTMGLKGLGFRV